MKDTLVCSAIGIAKFVLAGLITLLFRLVTPLLGWPNITPLMATELAGAKAYGPYIGALYGGLSMVTLDYCMGAIGPWTASTALSYAIVAFVGGLYLRKKANSITNFLLVSVAGTLFFDLVTGILFAPLHGLSFTEATLGQIPFTIYHLAGNSFFALFAPWFCSNIMSNISLELKLLRREMAM